MEFSEIFPIKNKEDVKCSINKSFVDEIPRDRNSEFSVKEINDIVDLVVSMGCNVIQLPKEIVEQFTLSGVTVNKFDPSAVRLYLKDLHYNYMPIIDTVYKTKENVLKLLRFILSDSPNSSQLVPMTS